ncbi:SDR family oxidoreductase [Lentiprolixibacter aurantiacus]|uniref:SDR family oxidoreductase n=1 Tax=Lentiprolixibacter aurantiacus TaxID=2993939 RepID=A0AAE3SNE8_9FLAO|nr:SDR family oxidoreductase [Lentiprolixibacter aurantiacus]MCX2719445.1 SDR family oxidoreductase [Lentiprolixibacter aurantiacus]
MIIKDKIIWITGASSGIGEALAYAFNKLGNKVILSARSEDKLRMVAKNCPFPEMVSCLRMDLMEADTMEDTVRQAIGIFGRVDILVNNAGISQRSLIVDTQLSVYKQLMDVNYLGTVALSKTLLPYFIGQGSGHYVTVTSLMGKFGSPLRSGYCAAKHALHGFFDVMRMEHEKDGVGVTLVCPGFVQTDIARNALTADGSAQNYQDKATANGLTPAEFANRLIKAVQKKKFEAYIGKGEVRGVYLKRFFPRLLHKVVLKSQVV